MPRKKITFDTVREMGLALPDVTEGTTYRSPALKVRGTMFACLAVHKSAEPDDELQEKGGSKSKTRPTC